MTSHISTDELLSEESINILYTGRQPIDWLHSLTEESETGIFVTFIVITACDKGRNPLVYCVGKCAGEVKGKPWLTLWCHG
jgi:hypothetical protein